MRASPTAAGQANALWRSLALQPVAAHTTLRVGSSTEAAEHAADRAANAAVGWPSGAQGGRAPLPSLGAAPAPPIVHEALQSPSQPLNGDMRAFMESRLGGEFGHVRVHTGAVAHRANEALQARAFTSGQNVAFAAGQYAPGTRAGRQLIAHELAHVQQQSGATGADANTVRRAPALSGRKTTELIDESIASDVDSALASSTILRKYVDPKSLKKIVGHVSVDNPKVYAALYAKYAKRHRDMPDVKNVPGYTDRANNSIELKQRSADVEVIIHEAVHFNSHERFANAFGHALNEGLTQYFTEAILAEQQLGSGRAYRDELKLATAFVASVGEDAAGKAYFSGDQTAQKATLAALTQAGTFAAWNRAVQSDKPADWKEAARLLTATMGR